MKGSLIVLTFFLTTCTFGQGDPPIGTGESDSCWIYVPNNITPDCDSYPCDGLRAYSFCELKEYRLEIFDKSGDTLFVTKDISVHWRPWFEDNYDAISERENFVWQITYIDLAGIQRMARGHFWLLK